MVTAVLAILSALLKWFLSGARFLIPLILTVPGLMAVALTAIGAFAATIFSRFTWLEGATQQVQQATSTIQQLAGEELGEVGNFLLGWFGFGHLANAIIATITMTVGATVAVFVTLLVGAVAIVPLVYAVRAALRTISLAKSQLGK